MKFSVYGTVCVLLCILTAPTFADIVIVGGSHDQREALQNTYHCIVPSRFHTSTLIPVQLLNDQAMDRYLNDGNDSLSASKDADDTVDGVYEDGPALITLRSSRPTVELEYTVSHEYGHFIWQTQLSTAQRSAFGRIYQTQKRLGRLVSDYAEDSVNEGFAEAFATYATNPTLLKAKDSLSYTFIDMLTAKEQSSYLGGRPAKESNVIIASR